MEDWPAIDAYIAKRLASSKLSLDVRTMTKAHKILFLITDAWDCFVDPSHPSMPNYYEKALPKSVRYATPDMVREAKRLRDAIQKMSAAEHISEVIWRDGKTKINVAEALVEINKNLKFSEEVNNAPPPKIPLPKSKIKKIQKRRLKSL
jgi:hypothetical protein